MLDTDLPLDETDADPDPVVEFRRWFRLAGEAGEPEPRAMTLATAGPDGEPSARMVLLHQVDDRGFVFFTNYESPKGRDLAVNPRAALVFYWPRLHRQVRAQGPVARVGLKESLAYWAGRPYGSRISASISAQSSVIPHRSVLEAAARELETRYPNAPPLPDFWGGYRVTPENIEFWQGRRHRLHDRLRYVREAARWRVERLAP